MTSGKTHYYFDLYLNYISDNSHLTEKHMVRKTIFLKPLNDFLKVKV